MAKLIRTAIECGYKHYNMCLYGPDPGKKSCITNNEQNFPNDCPLEEGVPIKKNSEDCGNNHKHTYYKNGKRVYPRRSRKQCVYFNSGTMSKNNCKSGTFRKPGSMVYPKCIGVNCGQFTKPIPDTCCGIYNY